MSARVDEKTKEIVLRRIEQLMEFWSITPGEVRRALRENPIAPARDEAPAPIKYRHPISGLTWDGQGEQPEWLRHALLKEGYTVQALRVAADQVSG